MVEQGITSMVEGFNSIGNFIYEIIRKPYAMYFISLFFFTLLIVTIIKTALKRVPLFEGSGDSIVNPQGNIIAWCIGLLSSLSLG